VICLIAVNAIIASAQISNDLAHYKFEMMELPNGPKGNHIYDIAQDSLGFLWLATGNGLVRWDGYKYKSYKHDPQDSTSIASDVVGALEIDKDGNLWIGLNRARLDRFNYENESFLHYRLSTGQELFSNDPFLDAKVDFEGNLWLGSNNGLHRFDLEEKHFESFYHNLNDKNSLSSDRCFLVFLDNDDELFIGTGTDFFGRNGSLHKYVRESNTFIKYRPELSPKMGKQNSWLTAATQDSRGNFWIGTWYDGLYRFKKEDGSILKVNDPISLDDDPMNGIYSDESGSKSVTSIFEDRDSTLWISTWSGGIRNYDPETGAYQDYFSDQNDENGYIEPFPTQMFQTRDGCLWMTTGFNYARLYRLNPKIFKTYAIPQIKDLKINYFGERKNGEMVLTTEYDPRLLIFNPRTSILEYLNKENDWDYISPDGKALSYSIDPFKPLWKIAGDDRGHMWYNGFQRQEVYEMDIEREQIIVHTSQDLYDHQPDAWVSEIFSDDAGEIWLTTNQGTLLEYNQDNHQFSKYLFGEDQLDAGRDYYSMMAEGSDNNLWIAYTFNPHDRPGLIRFDKGNKTIEEIKLKVNQVEVPIEFRLLNQILEDDNGYVWICLDTRLLKIDPESGETVIYNASYFDLSELNTIIIDDYNRLWVFGSKLVLMDISKESISSYELPIAKIGDRYFDKIMEYRAFKNRAGEIYVGTPVGFGHFNPLEFLDTISVPTETVISKFEVLFQNDLSQDRINDKYFEFKDPIRLNYNQNNFIFHFSSLHFRDIENSRYQYMLAGYDDQWRTSEGEPIANYIKVPDGTYQFKVRSSINGNDWGPEAVVSLKILPPLWGSNWAYLCYFILFVSLLYYFYQFTLKQKLQKAETQRLSDLNKVKTRLYTNITHEFRTPLTIISGMASQIKENPKEWFSEGMNMIQRNTDQLLYQVNQMLALSKLESGNIPLQLVHGDIIKFLKYISESHHSYAARKNIRIHFYSEEEDLLMNFDAEKLQQVLSNLITNAVKFSDEGGNIYISTESQPINEESGKNLGKKMLQIKIRDTGIGIPEEDLPFIFDRFYQVDDSSTREQDGSGIGLSIVKEMVGLMRGQISLTSKMGQETIFTILLPIGLRAGRKVERINSFSSHINEMKEEKEVRLKESREQEQFINQSLPTVLLIEDNPDVVAYVAICLGNEYHLKVGENGQEGIDIAMEIIPDLIITDVMMPIKDGYEVCSTLKNNQLTSHIPIVMLTAKADHESRLEGLEQGADAYLVKPFQKDELLLRLRKLIELRSKLQAYYQSFITENGQSTNPSGDLAIMTIDNNLVNKARDLVMASLDDVDLSVDKICKEIGMSRSQLHRKLTAIVGYSPNNFIKAIRLNEAKKLLLIQEYNINEIAYMIGFNDPSYFGRAFKKEFGMTPKSFSNNSLLKDHQPK
jgi:signal transduction histidine kinase/DNA-binding response OmpR family regulator/ligand-binding sensor domain-containing protein